MYFICSNVLIAKFDFIVKCICRVYSLTGAYRKVFIKVDDLKWYFMKYNHENDTLIRSDLEELRGVDEPKSVENGKMTALILELSLPASSYATMALREITKTNTSTAHQIQLQQSISSNLEDKPTDDKIVDIELDEPVVEAKKAKIQE